MIPSPLASDFIQSRPSLACQVHPLADGAWRDPIEFGQLDHAEATSRPRQGIDLTLVMGLSPVLVPQVCVCARDGSQR